MSMVTANPLMVTYILIMCMYQLLISGTHYGDVNFNYSDQVNQCRRYVCKRLYKLSNCLEHSSTSPVRSVQVLNPLPSQGFQSISHTGLALIEESRLTIKDTVQFAMVNMNGMLYIG